VSLLLKQEECQQNSYGRFDDLVMEFTKIAAIYAPRGSVAGIATKLQSVF
jgi:hypothetical protein